MVYVLTVGECDFKNAPVCGHGDGENRHSEVAAITRGGPCRNRCNASEERICDTFINLC